MSSIVGFGVLMSCATSPYTVNQSVSPALLEQKTVFLDTVLMQRNLPVLPLIDAGIYRVAVEAAKESLARVESSKLKFMNDEIAAEYEDLFHAELIRCAFPFSEDEDPGNVPFYYYTQESRVPDKIAKLCAENDAELVVATVAQITTTGVSAFGIKGNSHLKLSLCIFDKTGALVAQGEVESPPRVSTPDDTGMHGLLFDEGVIYYSLLLQNLAN
jgi:hypothetical protein